MDEIIALDDKALNQVVGMKKLAPYREDATKLRPNYKALQMIREEFQQTGDLGGWSDGGGVRGIKYWNTYHSAYPLTIVLLCASGPGPGPILIPLCGAPAV